MGRCWEEVGLDQSRKEGQGRAGSERQGREQRRLTVTSSAGSALQGCRAQVPYCGQLDLLALWPARPGHRSPLAMPSAPAIVPSTRLAQAEPAA